MSWKKITTAVLVFLIGSLGTFFALKYSFPSSSKPAYIIRSSVADLGLVQHEVIGFLPYWLLDKANQDYSQYITTLTYFGLTVAHDGTIKKFVKPGESEPGWRTLTSGKVDKFLNNARNNNIKLSLLIFSGNEKEIKELMSNPHKHADALMQEIDPIMKKYGFNDLNLDIETVKDVTSADQLKFAEFVKEIKNYLVQKKLGTLTIDFSPTDLIKKRLIDPSRIAALSDNMMLMGYDYHYVGSLVTGPVAPINGAELDAEFDVETAIQLALKIIPKEKITLGIPLYGYGWETLLQLPRAAVMPDSGAVMSNKRVENLILSCATCSVKLDGEAKESYIIYKDKITGTYRQIFYPDKYTTQEKIKLALKYQLSGMAVWALGYEGNNILTPLTKYIQILK